MNLFRGMDIASSGMAGAQKRMEAASRNLASARVALPPGSTQASLEAVSVGPPAQQMVQDPVLASLVGGKAGPEPLQSSAITKPAAVRYELDPAHPMADARGMVAYPDVQFVDEMVAIIEASRSFEASVTAYTETRNLMQKALELGRG